MLQVWSAENFLSSKENFCKNQPKSKISILNFIFKMLRAKRSHAAEQRERDRRRALVLEAAHAKKEEELGDQLLGDIIASVPRTTPKLIEDVLRKVRNQDENDGNNLKAALDQSTMLKVNLDGMDPSELWSDPVRNLWQETIQVLVRQTSRWKVTPLTMVHPFYGKVAVVISLCGKCRPQNEYERMRLFARTLRDGLDHLLNDIHPVMDEKVGRSIPKQETKEILLDVSREMSQNGDLSEVTDTCSEDDSDNEEDFKEFDNDVEAVTEDWTKDKPVNRPARLTVTPSQLSPVSSPAPLLTPEQPKHSSSFDQPLTDVESPTSPPTVTKDPALTQETSSPLLTRTRAYTDGSTRAFMSERPQVSRTLFPRTMAPNRVVTFTPPPASSTMLDLPASPILKQASESGIDLSKGYTVLPYQPENQQRSPKKPKRSDAGKKKEFKKKRPVSSPNYPNAKSRGPSRRDSELGTTTNAVRLLQVQQANQSDILQQVADQMNQLTYSLMELNSRNHQ